MIKKMMMPAPFLVAGAFSLLFGLVSFVGLPCPDCSGTGSLGGSGGLSARLSAGDMKESFIPLTCCDHPQVQYTYNISLSVTNAGARETTGTVMVGFYDIEPALSASKEVNPAPEDIIPIKVTVPAGKTIEVDQELSFIAVSDIMNQPHRITVQMTGDEGTPSACPQCNGTGRLGFYQWLEARVK
jgi:hypothetical protein